MKKYLALFLACCFSLPLYADITIEGPTKVKRDKLIKLVLKGYDSKAGIIWRFDKKKLDGTAKGDKAWLVGPPGEYVIEVLSLKLDKEGNTIVEEATTTVVVEDGVNPVPPTPTPTPTPTPVPVPDAPIKVDGLHILITYDENKVINMPIAQQNILYSVPFRQWLDSQCTNAPDGKTKAWRMWPNSSKTDKEAPLWQEAFKRDKKSLPWVLISNYPKKGGYEGPLPDNIEKFKDLISKYTN